MSKKLYIKTFGCQMNEYDSNKMEDVLADSHGMSLTTVADEADMILFNTCSIREKAQEKLFSELGRWKKLKDKNPELVIGVGGCVASQEGEQIWKRAPYVDMIFGPQTLHRLPEMYERVQKEKASIVDISFPEIEKFDRLPEPRAEGPTAFVSIMEGCSKYCTYCVVPYTRGEEISRPLDDVIAEVVMLAEKGVREVTLLGQNVNAYRGETFDGEIADFAVLIEYVAAIDGIDRIRYTTSHPMEFSDSIIDMYARVPELVNHLHLPVQSGSDRILALMKRNHMILEFKSKVRKLKAIRPDLTLSSDFIVGFPGETDKDFADTMKLIEEIGFDQSFSFIYSQRPGTPAANLPDDVSQETKKARLKTLQDCINNNAAEYARQMVGSRQTILVEGPSRKSSKQMSGRTENNRIVNFDGHERLKGLFVDVEITEALPNSLRGKFIELAALEQARQQQRQNSLAS